MTIEGEYARATALVTALIHGDEEAVTTIIAEKSTMFLALALAHMVAFSTVSMAKHLTITPDEMWQRMALAHAWIENGLPEPE